MKISLLNINITIIMICVLLVFDFRLGSDPDKLFSYEMMHEHFQKFAKFGILVASMILPILTLDADASIDLDDLAENLESGQDINAENPFCSNQLVFYRKMQDVIVDMDRLGYI